MPNPMLSRRLPAQVVPGPRGAWRVSLLAPLLALAACGGGGGGTDTPAPEPVAVVTDLGCAADQSVAHPLGRLHNNTWNLSAIGTQAWRQCMARREVAGVQQPGWTWQWPDTSPGVLAYPSLVIGAKPWEDGASNDARFPRPIATTRTLRLAYDLVTQSTGRNNLATSMWLISTPTVASPADLTAITTEVMVWTRASGGDWTGGTPALAEVTIDGRRWQVYGRRDQTDASGLSGHQWALLVYVAVEPTDQASIDLRAILNDGIARGWVRPGDHIADVELGNEVATGSGSTWLRSFSLTVE